MGALFEIYNQVVLKTRQIQERIQSIDNEIKRLSTDHSESRLARIAKLEEQLVKIDDYLLKIKGFQELAKKNLDSQNVLTIEAPPGYRVNLNRLRNWAMMIDPSSSNDPYAQRVYIVAKCDEWFLEKKKKEFQERIEQLKNEQNEDKSEDINRLIESKQSLVTALNQFAMSSEMIDFAKRVVEDNDQYWFKQAPDTFINPSSPLEFISPGAYALTLPFEREQRASIKNLIGSYYDVESGKVLLPITLNNRSEYVLTVTCSPFKRKNLDKALQNLILLSLTSNPAGSRRIQVIDGVRYNSSSLGGLKQIEGTFVCDQIPRNPEQLGNTLEQIVSSLADIDETIEQFDSVKEYNEQAEETKRVPLRTLVLIGWPSAYEAHDRELIQRIMTNYERYGISIIAIKYSNNDKMDEDLKLYPEYAMQNAIHISMMQNETTITIPGKQTQRFTWYTFSETLQDNFLRSLNEHYHARKTIGNEYIKRYSLTEIPAYVRTYKPIELPFGVDGKDDAHSVSFENENFATYLVGASRSGKSTLLHTLIAGLIRNYHPDNVELWLADFKQLEFKRYINHLPPHVKYVLLDESTELVFDLIDKLTNEMLQRQQLFARLGVQRIDQVDTTTLDKPLPVIFVILDEFSIMSQSIAESPIYKLRLQNILAKGAALGIKFLFSSQTFTTGVAGLTATARAQIQQRIAMKGSKEEISETLELSAALKTEQVRNWMEALPPHYALVKFRISADTLPQVKRYLVMYFKDYSPRDRMIEQIKDGMHVVDSYNPNDITSYTNKHPVLVDGNAYDAFNADELSEYINNIKHNGISDLAGDEMLLSFGTPRLMEKMKCAVLSSETRENIILFSRAAEQACTVSVVLSALRSYKEQGGKVQIWAYEKDRLYRAYKQIFTDYGIEVIEGIDAVCDAISLLKQSILKKESGNTLIALIGMERICLDFDFIDDSPSSSTSSEKGSTIGSLRQSFIESGAVVNSDSEEAKRQYALAWIKRRNSLKKGYASQGKNPEEIAELLQKDELAFRQEQGLENAFKPTSSMPQPINQISHIQTNFPKDDSLSFERKGAYKAQDDFTYIVKQGSRLGYHFMLNLSAFADLKQCGLKIDYFRYRMAFQLSVEESRNVFNSKIASSIPEHICQFDDTLEKYSFRPYLHKGIGWDGWSVAENGKVISPYKDEE